LANDSLPIPEDKMNRSSYVTSTRLAELERQLSERDEAIVATLDRVRIATGAQLRRLHLAEGNANSTTRRMQHVLSRLVGLRALARLDRQVGGVRAGSSGFVYALDVAGQRLASACGPAGGRRLRRPWTPSPAFVAHQLQVTELYVRLIEAERQGALELLAFDAEPLCWRTFTGLGGGRVVLKPDAFLRIGLGEFEDSYFVELDRATQSGPAITRKLALYRRYFQTGREQARWEVFPKVLLLAPHAARAAALASLVTQSRTPELFAATRFDHALIALTSEEVA
jgi:hypothetical protein